MLRHPGCFFRSLAWSVPAWRTDGHIMSAIAPVLAVPLGTLGSRLLVRAQRTNPAEGEDR